MTSPDALDNIQYEAGEPVIRNKSQSKASKMKRNESKSLNLMESDEMSNYIVSILKKSKKELSLAEIENLVPRTDSLVSFFSEDSSNLFECIKKNMDDEKNFNRDGKLKILILSSSAIRATELIRQLGSLRQNYGVGKCFAKHFKIEDQLKFFDANCPTISIGTPNRIAKLFAADHKYFDMSSVKLCIIDTHRDLKQRNIFEIPETCSDLLDFYINFVTPSLKSGATKLIFF